MVDDPFNLRFGTGRSGYLRDLPRTLLDALIHIGVRETLRNGATERLLSRRHADKGRQMGWI